MNTIVIVTDPADSDVGDGIVMNVSSEQLKILKTLAEYEFISLDYAIDYVDEVE